MPTPPDAAVIRRLALLVPSSFIPAPFELRMACKADIPATGREHPSMAETPSGLFTVNLGIAIANSASEPPFWVKNIDNQKQELPPMSTTNYTSFYKCNGVAAKWATLINYHKDTDTCQK